MHELAVTRNVLAIALGEAEAHGAKRIKSIRLAVGELSCVDPSSFSFCFEVVSRGTIAEGAKLEFERVKATARCDICHMTWAPQDSPCLCPSCGNSVGEVFEGQELRVDSLEID